jgi:hypothetical protein
MEPGEGLTRRIAHGKITLWELKLQLKAVRAMNPDTQVLYEPWLPPNTVIVTHADEDTIRNHGRPHQ